MIQDPTEMTVELERGIWSELIILIFFIQKNYWINATLFSNLGSIRKQKHRIKEK